MRKTCFNQTELAARWKISPRTLERWRWIGDGPRFPKIGGRVVSRIEAFVQIHNSSHGKYARRSVNYASRAVET